MSSSATTVKVLVGQVVDNKGSPVTLYKLWMDAGDLSLSFSSFTKVAEFDLSAESTAVSSMQFEVTNVIAASKYRFVATALNSIGESTGSAEARFAAASLPAKPGVILRGAGSTENQLQVEWNIEPDNEILISGYTLEVDLNQCGDFVEIWNGAGQPEVRTYSITTVTTGLYYSFRHKAMNYNGKSDDYSDVFITYACVMPA